jgi:hypothetical protein
VQAIGVGGKLGEFGFKDEDFAVEPAIFVVNPGFVQF